MTKSEMEELEKWIAINVMDEMPRIQAHALDAEEKFTALWEDDHITRKCVRDFCEENPEYHYKECEVYKHYTTDPAPAFDLLKKCAEKLGEKEAIEVQTRYGVWNVSAWPVSKIETEAPTLELAICQFAKLVFTKE